MQTKSFKIFQMFESKLNLCVTHPKTTFNDLKMKLKVNNSLSSTISRNIFTKFDFNYLSSLLVYKPHLNIQLFI